MAMQIKSAEEILLMPGLWMTRQMARYRSGIPLTATVTHAGSKGKKERRALSPARWGMRPKSRNTPETMVMGRPAKKSLSFLSKGDPPDGALCA